MKKFKIVLAGMEQRTLDASGYFISEGILTLYVNEDGLSYRHIASYSDGIWWSIEELIEKNVTR